MVANGMLISAALDYWGQYQLSKLLSNISPLASNAYRRMERGNYFPNGAEMKALNEELLPEMTRVNAEADTVLYMMIAPMATSPRERLRLALPRAKKLS
jgi:hypothetical protein